MTYNKEQQLDHQPGDRKAVGSIPIGSFFGRILAEEQETHEKLRCGHISLKK